MILIIVVFCFFFFVFLYFFFFNDTATTEIYTLSLHDALPISQQLLARCGYNRVLLSGQDGSITIHPGAGPVPKKTGQ